MRTLSYQQAINEALTQSMELDDSVVVYGIDCGDHKKCFGTHDGLVEKFGDRCFSTPLSEDALTGIGCGMAINGLRPVNVHMRADFLPLCMNQLSNMVSAQEFMSNGRLKCPLTIRAIVGRGWGQGYQHSKSMISSYAHIPGINVFCPSMAVDAKNMLTSAIFGDTPTIIFEHRWLYWLYDGVQDWVIVDDFFPAREMRKGKDITIIANSWMCIEACIAADILKDAVSVGVVDIRSLTPMDVGGICSAVSKTGACLVVDNDWMIFGASAEIASQIGMECFYDLHVPVERIGWPNDHIPTARHMEEGFYPNAHTIVRKIEKMLDLKHMDLTDHPAVTYENLSEWKGPF